MPINWKQEKSRLDIVENKLRVKIAQKDQDPLIYPGLKFLINEYKLLLREAKGDLSDLMECTAKLSQLYDQLARHLHDTPGGHAFVDKKYGGPIRQAKNIIKNHRFHATQPGISLVINSAIKMMENFTSPQYNSWPRSHYALQTAYLYTVQFERFEYKLQQGLQASKAVQVNPVHNRIDYRQFQHMSQQTSLSSDAILLNNKKPAISSNQPLQSQSYKY